jgi:hypothetical protein
MTSFAERFLILQRNALQRNDVDNVEYCSLLQNAETEADIQSLFQFILKVADPDLFLIFIECFPPAKNMIPSPRTWKQYVTLFYSKYTTTPEECAYWKDLLQFALEATAADIRIQKEKGSMRFPFNYLQELESIHDDRRESMAVTRISLPDNMTHIHLPHIPEARPPTFGVSPSIRSPRAGKRIVMTI